MSLEKISVQKICDICNYPRSTFYNYFEDMDYCWIAIMDDMNIEKSMNQSGKQNAEHIFSILYDYFDGYRSQIQRVLL